MSEPTLFVQLFVGLLLTATGAHASCPIELSPPSVVVRYGDPVSVNCSTSETNFEGIGWEASQGGTGVELVNHLPWTVESLTEWTISAICFFTPVGPSEQCSKGVKVVLYTFPETINISSSSGPDGVMNEGQQYNFTCDIGNIAPVQNLTVKWYKGDTNIRTDTFDNPAKHPVDPSPYLGFTPTRQDNSATFRCEAHVDLGPEGPRLHVSSQDYDITVYFGPDIQCAAIQLLEEETLEVNCPVTGNPTPYVRWLKDEQPIDPTIPLRRENAGMYTLEAEGFTSVQRKIQVIVLYGPELMCPSTYTALEYTPHNLTCIVKGYPEPVTMWYKDDEEVELPRNLTRLDAGQYLITASSPFSSVNFTVDIIVLYPPSQIVELEDSEVHVGSTVWLKCSSMSNPRPTYSWDYYKSANVMEETEDGVSRLLIHNATGYNMGSYTCHARNDRGSVSKTVRVTVNGAKQECPIKITPDTMVIPYQSTGQRATCTSTSTNSTNVKDIYWQVHQDIASGSSWLADTHEDWDASPVCVATFRGLGRCHKALNFILYKEPDSVSIRPVHNASSLVEGRELHLQCDITSVAPAQNLTVRWYQGNVSIEPGPLRLTDCQPENNTSCDIGAIRSPVNVTSTVSIALNRKHSGEEFRCEAQLDLVPEQSQRPANKSSSLNITVFYKPTINTTKLPKTVPVFSGYSEELVCEVDGYPPPKIQWLYSSDKVIHVSEGQLIVSEAGFYNCTATNHVDTALHVVEVVLEVDYLPLIAGFVAVTVVIISVIFIFIYSIYYKNTKMRRYSLKNPKLSTHNGNVAHNGWDMQFPMTKLS